MPAPPVAPREPFVTQVHGQARVDDYHWLRDKDSPRVRAHLQAENAYTMAVMAHTEAFRETLYREMLARIQETDMDVPYRDGPFEYYARTEQGKDYPILCRRPRAGGAEQATLDMNAMAQGHDSSRWAPTR
jgi:oligopeptidase B